MKLETYPLGRHTHHLPSSRGRVAFWGTVLVGLHLLVGVAGAAVDSGSAGQVELLLVPRTADAGTAAGSVLIEGRVAPVLDQQPVLAGAWHIHITVDEPLVRAETLKSL